MFCDFTKKYINYFLENKYNLDDNNSLVLLLNNEKNNILKFIENNKIKINYNKNGSNNYNSKIVKYTNNFFVDTDNVLNELNFLNETIVIEWNTNKIIVKTNIVDDILIHKINIIIYIIEYLGTCNYLEIILILTDLKKHKPSTENEIVGPKHVNSGYCRHFKSNSKKTIYIWRYEEFEKVTFHEVIHALNLDKRDNITQPIIISKYHNYFEAITDFYAIIYHIIYLSLITNITPKLLLEIELGFIRNQAINVHNILKLNLNELQFIKINQGSNVFSYYIIKYLLFKYLLEINNIKTYLKKIKLNDLLKNVMKIKFKDYSYNNIKSLRMTLFQLK